MKRWFYPLGLVTLIGFFMMYLLISGDKAITIDEQFDQLLGGNKLITAFHYLGETEFVIIVMLLLLGYLWFRAKNYRGMLFVLLSVGVGNVFNQLLKKWIQRDRPDIENQLESFSFPSGHAMLGLLYLFTVAYFLTEHQSSKTVRILIWTIAVFLSCMIGLSRIAESRHFASDVFAGWMVGYSWFVLVALWYEFRNRKFQSVRSNV